MENPKVVTVINLYHAQSKRFIGILVLKEKPKKDQVERIIAYLKNIFRGTIECLSFDGDKQKIDALRHEGDVSFRTAEQNGGLLYTYFLYLSRTKVII